MAYQDPLRGDEGSFQLPRVRAHPLDARVPLGRDRVPAFPAARSRIACRWHARCCLHRMRTVHELRGIILAALACAHAPLACETDGTPGTTTTSGAGIAGP